VPPGLHYDEAIDARLAQEIRAGVRPIYFEEGWGRERCITIWWLPRSRRARSGLGADCVERAGLIRYWPRTSVRRLFGVPTALIGAA
jgi:hypothetical protein